MLSTEMKVNGVVVHYIHAYNTGKCSHGLCGYQVEVFSPESDSPYLKFKVSHNRGDGLVMLNTIINERILAETAEDEQ